VSDLPSGSVLGSSSSCRGISGRCWGVLAAAPRRWGVGGASAAARRRGFGRLGGGSGGGGAVARWRGDADVGMLASMRCCRRRGKEDATINIRWEVGGGRVTKGGVEVLVVRESRCRRAAVHRASADHSDRDAGRRCSAVRMRLRQWQPR
jgi:hypothetical protein